MGLIVALLIALVAGFAGPVMAGEGLEAAQTLTHAVPHTLAQAVDSEPVRDMRVEDVVEKAKQYQLWILLISAVLVVALLFAGGLLQPGGFAKAGLRDVSPMPAAVWVFAALVVFLALSSAGPVLQGTGWLDRTQMTDEHKQIVTALVGYLFAAIAGLGMLFIFIRSAPESGTKLSGLDAPVGLGCFVLAYPIVALAGMLGVLLHTQLSGGESPNAIAHPVLQRIVNDPQDVWSWALIVGAVIGAPIWEELVFRVFLQGALVKVTKSPWVSIIVSATLFALMHRLGPPETRLPWHALLAIFALGVSCGVGYERTKRVGVPITMHVCFNALNVLLALLMTTGGDQPVA